MPLRLKPASATNTAAIFSFVFSFDEVMLAQFLSSPRFETLPRKMWDGLTQNGLEDVLDPGPERSLEHLGGQLVRDHDGADVTSVLARRVVNAAGLSAPALATTFDGLDARHVPRAYFAKGNYFGFAARAP